MFQSTRPRGARQEMADAYGEYVDVSIHAPAWGATLHAQASQTDHGCFNPRARVGRDEALTREHYSLKFVSIHAPAWGATRGRLAAGDGQR